MPCPFTFSHSVSAYRSSWWRSHATLTWRIFIGTFGRANPTDFVVVLLEWRVTTKSCAAKIPAKFPYIFEQHVPYNNTYVVSGDRGGWHPSHLAFRFGNLPNHHHLLILPPRTKCELKRLRITELDIPASLLSSHPIPTSLCSDGLISFERDFFS